MAWQAALEAVIHHPLFGVGVTLGAYQLALAAYERTRWVFLQPVLVSMLTVIGILLLCGLSFAEYRGSVAALTLLLGPATVALAVPLYSQLRQLRKIWKPLTIALLIGSVTAIFSTVLIAWALGGSAETIMSVAPRSATMPIAMALAEQFNGQPSLAAVAVAITGIAGTIMARPLLNLLRIDRPEARGFAVGVTAHAIGTARALQVHETIGAFSAIGLSLNGIMTAVLVPFVPIVLRWLGVA